MSKDRVWINPKTYHVLGDTWSDWIRYPLKTYETQKSLKKGWEWNPLDVWSNILGGHNIFGFYHRGQWWSNDLWVYCQCRGRGSMNKTFVIHGTPIFFSEIAISSITEGGYTAWLNDVWAFLTDPHTIIFLLIVICATITFKLSKWGDYLLWSSLYSFYLPS